MRPTFVVEVACRGDTLMMIFNRQLLAESEDVEGEFSKRHGSLRIPPGGRRFWTPSLDLTIDDESQFDAASARLWGTFSPRAEIWTAFVFAIGTLVVVSIFASVFGIAQLALGTPPYALAIPVFAVALAGILYLAALVGQGLSISEMYRLRAFVDDCIREAENQPSFRPTNG